MLQKAISNKHVNVRKKSKWLQGSIPEFFIYLFLLDTTMTSETHISVLIQSCNDYYEVGTRRNVLVLHIILNSMDLQMLQKRRTWLQVAGIFVLRLKFLSTLSYLAIHLGWASSKAPFWLSKQEKSLELKQSVFFASRFKNFIHPEKFLEPLLKPFERILLA